jgi:type VI protein secretion system component VasK
VLYFRATAERRNNHSETIMAGENWHLSKSVPITFILAIIGQTGALVWFVASMSNGIDNNAKEIVRHDTRIKSLETVVQDQAVTMARIDENIKAIRNMMEAGR